MPWGARKRTGRESQTPTSVSGNRAERREYAVGDAIGGEYRVLEILHGGMGEVYVVRHREFALPIVLKSPPQDSELRAKQRFLAEARAWVAIGKHPNVVTAFQVLDIENRVFVAADYVDRDALGRNSVADFLERGRIPLPVAIKWAAQFCYALDHACLKGLVAHRDIKPSNLMVDSNGDLMVTDFGLALMSGDDKVGVSGTFAYMAPEQILGQSQDSRVDVYSFGVALFQMVAGSLPFQGPDARTVLRKHLSERPPPTETVLEPLISKCLAKRPEDRFSSFREMWSVVASIAAELGVEIPARPTAAGAANYDLYTKSMSLSALGEPEAALLAAEDYISKEPFDHRGWTQKGRLLLDAGRFKEAEEATGQSLKLNPSNSHAWNNLGVIHYKLGNDHDSAGSLFMALKMDPFNTGARLNLAGPLENLGRADEAIQILEDAIRLEPEKAKLWHTLGVLYLDMVDMNHAKSCFQKALGLDPAMGIASEALAAANDPHHEPDPILLLKNGRFDIARNALLRRTGLNPNDAAAWHNLGLAHLTEGFPKDAAKCFRRVLELEPNDTFAQDQLRSLEP